MSGSDVAALLAKATGSLAGDEARLEAELLLAHVLGKPRSWLYAHADRVVEVNQARAFELLLGRRCGGEPVAHILGSREFWSLELVVTPDTLIPRPETELLVELALLRLPSAGVPRVLDLGTGSGAIALALAHERPLARVTAVDAEARALEVARKNAARLGLGRIRFLHSNWFSAIRDESFDVIVGNPPYIADDDPHLLTGDLRAEPRSALASGPDGLRALAIIAASAPAHVAPDGWLLLEHGYQQAAAVRALLGAAGFTAVETFRDLEGRDRVSGGRLAG